MIDKYIRKIIYDVLDKTISDHIKDSLIQLDGSKLYMLLVPEGIDTEVLKKEMGPLAGKLNLVVVVSNGVKLIEFG